MGDISKDFNSLDFRCRCYKCRSQAITPITKIEAINALQLARDAFGKPLIVNCGVRCEEHNQAVGGEPDSRHLPCYADAIDIAIRDQTQNMAMFDALRQYFTRIELCRYHFHVDLKPGPAALLAGIE